MKTELTQLSALSDGIVIDPGDPSKISPTTPPDSTSMNGRWDSKPELKTTVIWTLMLHDQDAPYYDVSITYGRPDGQEVVKVTLNPAQKGTSQCNFSWSEEGQQQISVYGSIEVQTVIDGLKKTLTLSIQLAKPPGPLNESIINTYQYSDLSNGKNTIFQPIPSNTPVRAPTDTSTAPYCFAGQLKMEFTDKLTKQIKSYVGTATLIESKDKKDAGLYVLTCAHNLYDPTDGPATKVTFIPGMNAQPHPPATIEAESFHYPPQYTGVAISLGADRSMLAAEFLALNCQYDYGLVKLKQAHTIDKKYPSIEPFATDSDLKHNPHVALCGLYGWATDQSEMFLGEGNIDTIKLTGNTLEYNVSTRPGASGTAITSKGSDHIVGVHEGSGPSVGTFNLGHRLNLDSIAQIKGWQT